jgi:hypothetical protein
MVPTAKLTKRQEFFAKLLCSWLAILVFLFETCLRVDFLPVASSFFRQFFCLSPRSDSRDV